MHIPLYKRALSYIFPVLILRRSGEVHPLLELYLSRNQWQLATEDAYYSNGRKYRPMIEAFRRIGNSISGIGSVLVLGTGIGSAVHILEHRKIHPEYTLVELDKNILDLAIEIMPRKWKSRIHPVNDDAQNFMINNREKYHLIICDIFLGRVVPPFVSSHDFLRQCRSALFTGGSLILNFIQLDKTQFDALCSAMKLIFPRHKLITFGVNRVFVGNL